jgi:hypothetical protein
LECSWSETDYATLETRQLCKGSSSARATGGSAALGTLAASLAALAFEDWLAEGRPRVAYRESVVDARGSTAYSTAHRRRTSCPFDHRRWDIEPVAEMSTLRSLVASLGTASRVDLSPVDVRGITLRILGRVLVARTLCTGCARAEPVLTTIERISTLGGCPDCGEERVADPFACAEELCLDSIDSLDRPLRDGVETGDVITLVSRDGTRHVELTSTLASPDRAGAIAGTQPGLNP